MQRRNSHFLRNWVILFFILGVVIFGVFGYWNYLKSPLTGDSSLKAFVVQKGEGVSSVAERLEKEGIIRSSLAFKLVYKQREGAKIEAGSFKLSSGMSLEQIMDVLSKGAVDKWVTLLEGWRVEEMAERLNRDLGIKKEDFLNVAKEGYMFPDSYLFNQEASAQTIASTLKNTFEKRYTEEIRSKIAKQGLTADQGVILASLVEREARSDKVRTEIAGIMLKRLKIGMGLNVDATVQYALGYQDGEKSWWKRNLTYDDLRVDSPYNTYRYAGLPPAPICNPSLSSLKAVASADSATSYLYYLHDEQGNTYYGRTLDEHNSNIQRYR